MIHSNSFLKWAGILVFQTLTLLTVMCTKVVQFKEIPQQIPWKVMRNSERVGSYKFYRKEIRYNWIDKGSGGVGWRGEAENSNQAGIPWKEYRQFLVPHFFAEWNDNITTLQPFLQKVENARAYRGLPVNLCLEQADSAFSQIEKRLNPHILILNNSNVTLNSNQIRYPHHIIYPYTID